METVLFIVVLAAIAWCALSPDPLAETVRVRVLGLKTRAQRALDSAKDRALVSKRKAEEKQARANADLIEIKKVRRGLQNDLNEAKAKVTKYDGAADNAASVGNEVVATAAEKAMAEAQIQVNLIQPQYDKIVAKEAQVEAALTNFAKIIAARAFQVSEIDVRARSARSIGDANRLIAGLNIDGTDDDIKRAYDQVREAEAEADVWTEQAEKVQAGLKERADLEAFATGEAVQASVEDRVAARMAKFTKPAA